MVKRFPDLGLKRYAHRLLLVLIFSGCTFAQIIPPPIPGGAVPGANPGTTLPPPPVPVITDPSDITAVYQGLVGNWMTTVWPYAQAIFWSLLVMEVVWFGIELWRISRGELKGAMESLAFKIILLGFSFDVLLNAPAWMQDIISDFTTIGKAAAGIPGLGPSIIFQQGIAIAGDLMDASMSVGGLFNLPVAIAMIFTALMIGIAFLAIAFQFVVTTVQSYLVIGMGAVFLAFGASRWTMPYMERYFAFAMATGVKLMVLYMLTGAAWPLTNAWITRAKNASLSISSIEAALIIMGAAFIYAGLCWYASSHVSAMLGGSPNLTQSDFIHFMGPMITAAVAGGIAIGTGGAGAGLMGGGGIRALMSGGGSAAGGAVAASALGGGNPGPSRTPASSPASGGAGMGGAIAQIAARAISSAPSGGHTPTPPHFSHFNH